MNDNNREQSQPEKEEKGLGQITYPDDQVRREEPKQPPKDNNESSEEQNKKD